MTYGPTWKSSSPAGGGRESGRTSQDGRRSTYGSWFGLLQLLLRSVVVAVCRAERAETLRRRRSAAAVVDKLHDAKSILCQLRSRRSRRAEPADRPGCRSASPPGARARPGRLLRPWSGATAAPAAAALYLHCGSRRPPEPSAAAAAAAAAQPKSPIMLSRRRLPHRRLYVRMCLCVGLLRRQLPSDTGQPPARPPKLSIHDVIRPCQLCCLLEYHIDAAVGVISRSFYLSHQRRLRFPSCACLWTRELKMLSTNLCEIVNTGGMYD